MNKKLLILLTLTFGAVNMNTVAKTITNKQQQKQKILNFKNFLQTISPKSKKEKYFNEISKKINHDSNIAKTFFNDQSTFQYFTTKNPLKDMFADLEKIYLNSYLQYEKILNILKDTADSKLPAETILTKDSSLHGILNDIITMLINMSHNKQLKDLNPYRISRLLTYTYAHNELPTSILEQIIKRNLPKENPPDTNNGLIRFYKKYILTYLTLFQLLPQCKNLEDFYRESQKSYTETLVNHPKKCTRYVFISCGDDTYTPHYPDALKMVYNYISIYTKKNNSNDALEIDIDNMSIDKCEDRVDRYIATHPHIATFMNELMDTISMCVDRCTEDLKYLNNDTVPFIMNIPSNLVRFIHQADGLRHKQSTDDFHNYLKSLVYQTLQLLTNTSSQ